MFSNNRASLELAQLATAAQLPLATGRRIAVISVRGGAGKSAVAAMLASVYAVRRAEPVLAADADPEDGSLAWRLGVNPQLSLAALAPRLLAARGGDVRGYDQLLPRTRFGLWVLPGGATDHPRLARDVTRALSRLFTVCVTDCGRGVDSPTTAAVLSEAHAIVMVAPATPDGVRSTCDALRRVAALHRALSASRIIVALNTLDTNGHAALRDRVALEAFRPFDVPVVMLPYDRHLASGAPITPWQIGEAMVVEATRLAGHALARARQL